MKTGARYLKRGDTFDIEDARMTHRLRVARGILRGLGIEPTVEHGTGAINDAGWNRHACASNCKTVWPELATDDIFEYAFALASAFQTRRGDLAQRDINEARRQKETA